MRRDNKSPLKTIRMNAMIKVRLRNKVLHVILCSIVTSNRPLYYFLLHYILNRELRVIVDQVQTNYHGRPMVLKSVRCDRAVDFEGSSL